MVLVPEVVELKSAVSAVVKPGSENTGEQSQWIVGQAVDFIDPREAADIDSAA